MFPFLSIFDVGNLHCHWITGKEQFLLVYFWLDLFAEMAI